MLKFISSILILLLLFSCSRKKTELSSTDSLAYKKQWINPINFRDEFEKELSFPYWITPALVKEHRIQKLTRRIYPSDLDSIFEKKQLRGILPLEKREYYFDPNGFVDRYVIYVYYDDREISRKEYMYIGNMHANGFRKVERVFMHDKKDTVYIKSEYNTEVQNTRNDANVLYNLVVTKNKFKAYKDIETEDHIFEVKKSKYWGPLSIDSILHPQAKDWIVLGTIRKPYKRYKVENTVNESNVHTYKYSKNGLLIHKTMQEYPFERKRSFSYNKQSDWISYVDSVFTENIFIYCKNYYWKFDEYGRPDYLYELRIKGGTKQKQFIEIYDYQTHK